MAILNGANSTYQLEQTAGLCCNYPGAFSALCACAWLCNMTVSPNPSTFLRFIFGNTKTTGIRLSSGEWKIPID